MRFTHWPLWIYATLAGILVGFGPMQSHGQSVRVDENEESIKVWQDDQIVLTYNKVSPAAPKGIDPIYERSGFLHPVTTPSGKVVTASFPPDHPHQQGIFSAWVKTSFDNRSVDFWNLASGTGRVLHERVVSTNVENDQASFQVDLIHRAMEPPIVDVLRERWQITVHASPPSHRCFDLELTQTALTSTPLEIHQHRYGGFAVRGPGDWLLRGDRDQPAGGNSNELENTLGAPSTFLNDTGSDRLDGNHEHARWVALSGDLQGDPASIIVLGHPDNFRAPQTVRMHPTKPYFTWAPCVDAPFVIDATHPYAARYRFLITDAAPDPSWIESQWETWIQD